MPEAAGSTTRNENDSSARRQRPLAQLF
jgi:hypothetical protein